MGSKYSKKLKSMVWTFHAIIEASSSADGYSPQQAIKKMKAFRQDKGISYEDYWTIVKMDQGKMFESLDPLARFSVDPMVQAALDCRLAELQELGSG